MSVVARAHGELFTGSCCFWSMTSNSPLACTLEANARTKIKHQTPPKKHPRDQTRRSAAVKLGPRCCHNVSSVFYCLVCFVGLSFVLFFSLFGRLLCSGPWSIFFSLCSSFSRVQLVPQWWRAPRRPHGWRQLSLPQQLATTARSTCPATARRGASAGRDAQTKSNVAGTLAAVAHACAAGRADTKSDTKTGGRFVMKNTIFPLGICPVCAIGAI